MLEKTLESPLDCKEIQSVHSEDQPWDFFGGNDAKAETLGLWPPHAKSWLIGKDSDAGRDWGQEEKGMTEDEMAEWHHWLDGREFEWTLGGGDGQGVLACCNLWGRRVGHDWVTELKLKLSFKESVAKCLKQNKLYKPNCVLLGSITKKRGKFQVNMKQYFNWITLLWNFWKTKKGKLNSVFSNYRVSDNVDVIILSL